MQLFSHRRETVVVTRFYDKSPDVPPPPQYFAYGNTQQLYEELTSDDPVLYVQQLSDSDSEHSGSQGGGRDCLRMSYIFVAAKQIYVFISYWLRS